MICYCLFCVTQKTTQIMEVLSNDKVQNKVTVLQPRIVQRKWVGKKAVEELHTYLPGYLFLYAEEPIHRFSALLGLDGALRLLGSKEDDYELKGADLDFALALYRQDGIIGTAKAYQEGDQVKLADGILADANGQILKVDRRRQRALVQFQFADADRRVWVGYDLIEK